NLNLAVLAAAFAEPSPKLAFGSPGVFLQPVELLAKDRRLRVERDLGLNSRDSGRRSVSFFCISGLVWSGSIAEHDSVLARCVLGVCSWHGCSCFTVPFLGGGFCLI